ncbi:serine hydrolase domain-containing protein [Synechococcus elongatus IITB4]|uniref:serine hydrolase domain-containing protein n=1 Tax=Synechococcus elongatus TaxID=32046 RepID=UPI0030D4F434
MRSRQVWIGFSLLLIWTVAILAVVYLEALWWGHPALRPGNLASLETYIQTQLEQAEGRSLGSAALLLVRDREVVKTETFGVANPQMRSPVIADQTLYQMASVSKMVAAWGVLKLVELGKVQLQDPVLPYLNRWQFPQANPYRSQVTIAQLLSHTGGLTDQFGYAGFLPEVQLPTLEQSLTRTEDVAFGLPRGVEAQLAPGLDWRYSGGGYSVLQLLIEEVSGQSFAQFMQEQILNPLGMSQSSFDWSALATQGETTNLATSFTEALEPSPHRQYVATAAASLYATLEDMGRFAIANLDPNPVLKASTLASMWKPQPGTQGDWGLGYAIYQALPTGGAIVGHDGNNVPALNHTVRLNPQTGDAIVLLISGNRQLASDLGADWVYWETGRVQPEAQFRYWQARLWAAGLLISLGAIAIGVMFLRRTQPWL